MMFFEHRREPVISRFAFWKRVAWHLFIANIFLAISLAVGTVGLHATEQGISWLDALLNSAMLLGGMGPTTTPTSDSGKWFSTFYALYAGLFFVATTGWILAPVFHRVVHKLHADEQDTL